MEQRITFEKDRKLSKSGHARIAEILRKEGARNIKVEEINLMEEAEDIEKAEKIN